LSTTQNFDEAFDDPKFVEQLRTEISKKSGLSEEEIEIRFGYHPPSSWDGENTIEMHQELYDAFKDFARYLGLLLPNGRAKSVALNELENASMWSHKAISPMDPLGVKTA
jgi:hypothetical protein